MASIRRPGKIDAKGRLRTSSAMPIEDASSVSGLLTLLTAHLDGARIEVNAQHMCNRFDPTHILASKHAGTDA